MPEQEFNRVFLLVVTSVVVEDPDLFDPAYNHPNRKKYAYFINYFNLFLARSPNRFNSLCIPT